MHRTQAEAEAASVAHKQQEIAAKEKALAKLGEERARLTATRDERQDDRKVRACVRWVCVIYSFYYYKLV